MTKRDDVKEIEIKNVSMTFGSKAGSVEAIKDVSFDVSKNEFVSIVGPTNYKRIYQNRP